MKVTNLVYFDFDELILAANNFPGIWNNKKLATISGLYFSNLSYDLTPPWYSILGDSAFLNRTRATNGKVLRGRTRNEAIDITETALLSVVDILLQIVMPMARQSAEWGLFATKEPFSGLKRPLPADCTKRLLLLTICCHLFRYRTNVVGLN